MVIRDNYQVLKMSTQEVDVISVYKSAEGDRNMLIDTILKLLVPDRATIVIGDFNICLFKEPNNIITTRLKHHGFRQLVQNSTFDSGSCIDHCYTNTTLDVDVAHHALYWSGHDALRVSLGGHS